MKAGESVEVLGTLLEDLLVDPLADLLACPAPEWARQGTQMLVALPAQRDGPPVVLELSPQAGAVLVVARVVGVTTGMRPARGTAPLDAEPSQVGWFAAVGLAARRLAGLEGSVSTQGTAGAEPVGIHFLNSSLAA